MEEKALFQTFVPVGGGALAAQLHELKGQLRDWLMAEALTPASLLQVRVYLSDAANQWEEVKLSPLYTCYLSAGAVSYVEQPLLCGAKVALQVWAVRAANVVKTGTLECRMVTMDGVRYIFHSVRFTGEEARNMDADAQTEKAFRRHIELLASEGLTLKDNCHRTWIYVRDIDRHYAGVVTARNRVFDKEGLTADTHFIASTGIGGCTADREALVAIDFLSVAGLGPDAVEYLHAPEYLNPTHEYGVAFERGTMLRLPEGNCYFVSGTASIDKKGDCVHRGDVMTQTGRLFLNIEKLLENKGATLSDLKYIIVYLRDVADYAAVAAYCRLRFPNLPLLITEARVCRPEWLIEVEGIAMRR